MRVSFETMTGGTSVVYSFFQHCIFCMLCRIACGEDLVARVTKLYLPFSWRFSLKPQSYDGGEKVVCPDTYAHDFRH
jgi:hypothetical protein